VWLRMSVHALKDGLDHSVQKVSLNHNLICHKQVAKWWSFFIAAVCEPSCLHGGRCVGPNQCDCTTEWTGEYCHIRKHYLKMHSRGINFENILIL
jgi:hypothetical protein